MIRAWQEEMNAADRVRVLMAFGFPGAALLHFVWLWMNGSLMYHGHAPAWAPAFWFTLCAIDLVVFWVLLTRPRIGLQMAVVEMAVVLWVNWTAFPTFEHGFNWVLVGLTGFGAFVFAMSPWLWVSSRWSLSASSARSGG